MIAAVVAMMMVKTSLMEEVKVVSVWDGGMMPVLGELLIVPVPDVLRASMVRRTPVEVLLADLEAMDLHHIALVVF